MSIAVIREFIQDKVMFSDNYFAVDASYTVKGSAAVTIPAVFSFDGGDSEFGMSLETEKTRGTVSIKKSDIANVKRHDTITYDGNTYLVLGLQTENTLNVIANIEKSKHESAGGLIHE